MAFGLKRYDLRKPDARFISKIDRRIAANFDWVLFGMIVFVIIIGLTNLYSATRIPGKVHFFNTQFRWSIIGLVFLSVAFIINYRIYEGVGYWIYFGLMTLLVAVLFFGPEINGATRWLQVGNLSFQPSEVAKIGLVMALAKYLASNRVPSGYNLRELVIPGLIILLPTVLIIREPDLGTAVLFMLIGMTMVLFSGVRKSSLIALVVIAAMMIPLAWTMLLSDYQQDRIRTWLEPSKDPLKSGYHIEQSLNAIGSGKLLGKGFLKGTQNKLGFLPEHHTDFIFSVFAEERGFVGCFILLILYMAIIIWCMSIALYSKDRFAAFMAVGLSAIIFWHTFINIGMVIGYAPVVGMPLPFMSYGRSSLITMMIVVGLLLNISSRRYMF